MKQHIIQRLAIVFLLYISFLPSAVADEKPAATITFSNNDQGKYIVWSASQSLAKINYVADKMSKLAVKAIANNYSANSSDLYYQDLKFKKLKYEIDDTINKSYAQFYLNKQEVNIDILNDGAGNHLSFHLPVMNWEDLFGSQPIDVSNKENAQRTASQLRMLIDKLNDMLPADTNPAHLSRFAVAKSQYTFQDKDNVLVLTNKMDSQALILSLVDFHRELSYLLDDMLALAERAAATGYVDETFKFSDKVSEFWNRFNEGFKAHLFNDSKLRFNLAGKTREYQFNKIDTQVFNLDQADLLSPENAIKVYSSTIMIYLWSMDWTVTGNSPFVASTKNLAKESLPSSLSTSLSKDEKIKMYRALHRSKE